MRETLAGSGPTVSVQVACDALGISKSTGYEAIHRGDFPAKVIKVGSAYRVVTADLRRLLQLEPAA